MNATIQDTLLDLFQQVIEGPDSMPVVPIDAWREGSEEKRLLTGFRDMLERLRQNKRQAEAELREREEQYRSIFEATTDALIICDLEGIVVEANPAACRISGEDYGEWIGTNISYPNPSRAQPHLDQAFFQTGGQFLNEPGKIQRKDGTLVPVEAHAINFTYKGQPHILTVVRDIAERVQSEQQLREKEEEYRSIFEASIDGLIIIDQDNRVVEANPAACQIHGYTHEELLGRSASLEAGNVHDIIRVGGEFHTRERGRRKDGTSFHSDVRGSPFTYKGKPHMLRIVRDITEQVEAEQQLREREEQYRSIFEATSDSMVIANLGGFVVEANPAACKMYGYSYEELLGLHRTVLTHEDYHYLVPESIQTVKEGGNYQARAVDRRKDGTPFPVDGRGTPFIYKGEPTILAVIRDITEQVEAEEQLREKEEQYRAVFEATTDALVVLDPDGFYVEANPAMCSLYGYTNEELIGLHTSALTAPESFHVLTESMEKIKVGRGFQAEGQGLRKDGSVFYAEAHLTPFTYQGKPHLLASSRDITERVQAQHLLEQRVEERTRELSTLLEVSHNVASTIELKPLLDLILDQLKVVVDYTGSAITILEGEDLVLIGTRGPESEEHLVQRRFPLKQVGLIWEKLCDGESVIIDNVRNDTPLAEAYREAVGDLLETTFRYVRSWVTVPLTLKEQVIGMLSASHGKPDYYTSHHADLAMAIANQAAVAIENARLYAQAQELAALEERQKLARELHDSVSQALYGISLGTHAARTALERDPDHVAEPLDYVLSLAEAGLAEMRALIFELRPESLEKEGLVSALTKQAAALQARHELVVSTELCDEPGLSLRVKQELYRIAQEAMHNIVKHAHARHVDLRLDQTPDEVILEVRDDGAGFDTTASFPGHLGLHSMRERITNLGGTFEIESTPGSGTRICVRIPGGV